MNLIIKTTHTWDAHKGSHREEGRGWKRRQRALQGFEHTHYPCILSHNYTNWAIPIPKGTLKLHFTNTFFVSLLPLFFCSFHKGKRLGSLLQIWWTTATKIFSTRWGQLEIWLIIATLPSVQWNWLVSQTLNMEKNLEKCGDTTTNRLTS